METSDRAKAAVRVALRAPHYDGNRLYPYHVPVICHWSPAGCFEVHCACGYITIVSEKELASLDNQPAAARLNPLVHPPHPVDVVTLKERK